MSSFHSNKQSNTTTTYKKWLDKSNTGIGVILHLKAYTGIEQPIKCVKPSCHCRGKTLDRRGMGHPALILSLWDERQSGGEQMALIGIISGNPYPTPGAKPIRIFRSNEIAKNNEEAIWLEGMGTMSKVSYLQLDHVYRVPFSKLSPFCATPFANRISSSYYQSLMEQYNLEPQAYVTTNFLRGKNTYDPNLDNTTLSTTIIKTPTITQQPTTTFLTPVLTKLQGQWLAPLMLIN